MRLQTRIDEDFMVESVACDGNEVKSTVYRIESGVVVSYPTLHTETVQIWNDLLYMHTALVTRCINGEFSK